MTEIDVFRFMVQGMHMESIELPYDAEPVDCVCEISQAKISRGYPSKSVIPNTVNDVLDLVGASKSGYVSEDAAKLFKGCWNLGSRAIFEDCSYHPLINRDAAQKQQRSCWSDLIRSVWETRKGDPCVLILATDYKKRIWYKSQLGQIGSNTPVLVYAPDVGISGVLTVNWEKLVEVLDLVEEIYAMGFTKTDISENLFRGYNVFVEHPDETVMFENQLREVRRSNEFIISTTVCQKKEPKK